MSFAVPLLCCLMVLLSNPALLWAKNTPPPPQSLQDLEVATTDLQENTKDLRRNITTWRKITAEAQLSAAEKKQWRLKAETYLQECRDYNAVLEKIDAQKLPPSEVSRRFLSARGTFQRELQYFQEILSQP